jgi:DNA-binding transcriptional MerR regulator
MRMSELSATSGVSVATIKFYLREGLVPAGERTSPNQALYNNAHLDRLRLVRALIDLGGLGVTAVRRVLAAVDDTAMPVEQTFGIAQHALPNPLPDLPGAPPGHGSEILDALVVAEGWLVEDANPGRAMVEKVLDTYESLGHPELASTISAYARAAAIVANADLDAVALQGDRAGMAQVVVVGTVLGDTLAAGLRRMAQEHITRTRFAPPQEGTIP